MLLAVSCAMRLSTTGAFSQSQKATGIIRTKLFSSSSDVMASALQSGVSRIGTLRSLLSKYGAPGSIGCSDPNDLVSVSTALDTPELISSLTDDELSNLHPHLFPIAKSNASGNYICALRRAYADDADYESSSDAPWPIVEAQLGGPGMRLLSLNSEHLMRRIACECDFAGIGDAVSEYNDGLGSGIVKEKGLDAPYEAGSAESLGYGVDKYVLLRVGPFPDLYEKMALGHAERGDEASSLIAAEASNGKFVGFGSTFRFYARLLMSFENRAEEARDAARMCLRLPLPSIGMTAEEFSETAVLAQLAKPTDSPEVAMAGIRDMYEKIKASEEEDPAANQGKTKEQMAIDEANYLLDSVVLNGGSWSEIRPKLGEIYSSAGRDDMATFVDPTRSS